MTVEDMAKVKEVGIYSGQISDLSALKSATGLERLVFPLNHISDLAPLSGLKNLNFLELNRNRISNLTPLAGLTNLKSLHLGDTKVTDVGIKKLQQALPNCRINLDSISDEVRAIIAEQLKGRE